MSLSDGVFLAISLLLMAYLAYALFRAERL
jgi:K+-transporting ATPase KdpF subunit